MSIGQLGSSGEQFRDFLGGGQRDIGRGLQAVLSSYANPEGNFVRLDNRSQGMFQLTNSEYQSVFDQDAQNSFAETWYSEYRVVLQLRAEALKKKLNRAYTKVLENSIYAPLRPNEDWAPGANRDFNDIDADSPTKMYSDGSGSGTTGIDGAPVIPSGTLEEIPTEYAHPDWFSGTDPLSTGEPYDDIRRYMAEKLLDQDGGNAYFSDIDQDGQKIYFRDPDPANTGDAFYDVGAEGGGNSQYYNLWNAGGGLGTPGLDTAYSLSSLSWSPSSGYSNARYSEIAQKMNVPPSTDTTNFVAEGNKPSGAAKNNTYFISIPPSQDSRDVWQFLPSFAQGTSGVFTAAQRTTAESNGVPSGNFVPVAPATTPATFVLAAGTTFYDPQGAINQSMFVTSPNIPAPGNGVASPSTNILNPKLVGPETSPAETPPKPFQDLEASPSNPVYHQGFIDSWMEARQVEKREAAVEAAYRAYVDGKAISDASPNPLTYEEIMDTVFSSLDTYDIDMGSIPGGGPTLPAGAEVSKNKLNGVLPYGYYSPTVAGGTPHTSVNPIFNVGGAYLGPGANAGNSLYQTVYNAVSVLADPSSVDTGGAASGAIGGAIPAGTPPVTGPAPPGQSYETLGGSSELFSPIPIGAAQNTDGTGQTDVDSDAGSGNLESTLYQVPGFITGIDQVSKLFVGRQWDYVPGHVPNSGQNTTDGVGAVRYAAETQSTHVHAGMGWYDADKDNAGQILLTMTPAIEGLVIQNIYDNIGVGMFDEQIQNGTWTSGFGAMGGPFFQVAGGEESVGFGIDIGGEDEYSWTSGGGIQIGGGIGGIFWGHTSAVGKIYRIDRLMEHSGGTGDQYTDDGLGGMGGGAPPLDAFGVMKASLAVMGALGGLDSNSTNPNDGMSVFPNIGIVGGHVDGNLPIPIPIPGGGLFWLNLPLTSYFSTSYDLVTDYMFQYLDAMKHEVLDSISAYSYATGGGYAMDSYGMRGEYQFTEKPALESLEKIPDLFGISLDGAIASAIDFLDLEDYTINGYNLKTGGALGNVDDQEAYRHSFTAPEQRELDTGAFFTTASFLSQFQLNDLEYSYWTSTHQNEEMVSFDTLRILSLTGKDLLQALSQFIFGMAGFTDDPDSDAASAMVEVMNFMLEGFEEQLNEAVMWDLLMRDQSDKGGVLKKSVIPTIASVSRSTSSLTSEGYDFLEDERKLFAYDYEEVRKPGILQQLRNFGQGSFELPNQLMAGTGNTRRYKPYLTGPDGRAGRQGYGANSAGTVNPGDFVNNNPDKNDRVHAITRHAGDTNDTYYDDNWDIRVGFWQDTGLGDVNEVYVRKNTVSYGGVNSGIGSGNASGPVVTTEIDRYVGSHNRIIGRGYDGAAPLDLQSFRTGYFSEKYFGHYISEVNFTGSGDHPTGDAAGDEAITYLLQGGIDGDPNRSGTITMHGGSKYYDRRNDYEFKMEAVDGTQVGLRADQALAPVLGGKMKLMSIESNNSNQVIGASTQNESNELTKVLYEHMRIRSDGSNAQLVKEYRDAFNLGYLDDIFITASADAATGGGVTSSIRIQFNNQSWSDGTVADLGGYETDRTQEVVGTGTLSTVPGYLGDRSYFKNVNRSVADIYLSSYFAFKRQPNTESK